LSKDKIIPRSLISVGLYMCVCVCVYVCKHKYIYAHTHTYILAVSCWSKGNIILRSLISVGLCMHVCVCACMYIYTYTYIHIHTYTHTYLSFQLHLKSQNHSAKFDFSRLLNIHTYIHPCAIGGCRHTNWCLILGCMSPLNQWYLTNTYSWLIYTYLHTYINTCAFSWQSTDKMVSHFRMYESVISP